MVHRSAESSSARSVGEELTNDHRLGPVLAVRCRPCEPVGPEFDSGDFEQVRRDVGVSRPQIVSADDRDVLVSRLRGEVFEPRPGIVPTAVRASLPSARRHARSPLVDRALIEPITALLGVDNRAALAIGVLNWGIFVHRRTRCWYIIVCYSGPTTAPPAVARRSSPRRSSDRPPAVVLIRGVRAVPSGTRVTASSRTTPLAGESESEAGPRRP